MPSNIKSIWGSNDDVNWTKITTAPTREEATSNVAGLAFGYDDRLEFKNLDNPNYYKYHAIVADAFTRLKDIKLFGIRNQGSSTLHDGALTLTKNLDVPRIGPPLDADDTPRRDRLVVEYNTSTNPTFEGAVRDTSGRGNDGFMSGSSYDTTNKFLSITNSETGTTSAATSYITRQSLGNKESGNFHHSVSLWFKMTTRVSSVYRTIFEIGPHPRVNGKDIGLYVTSDSATPFGFASGGNTLFSSGSAVSGQVYHIVIVYDGAKKYMYINGVLNNSAAYTSFDGVQNMTMQIGRNNHANANEGIDGSISNFKMYVGHALTEEEVKTLYDMGRCDEGHHTTTVSRSQLRMGGENLVIEPCIKGFYEEGTWSPIMGGQSGGQKTPTSSNRGWFVRIGNLVTIGGTLAWNSTDTISGNPILAGLPYKATSDAGGRCVLGMGVTPNGFATPSHCTTMRMIIDPNNQFAYIIASDDQNAVSYTHSVTISNAGLLYGLGGTYKI
jgi:hypothetical protein